MSKNLNENQIIGDKLPKPDWETARDMVSSPEKKGAVYLPKPHSQYSGKLLAMTDSHLIQQVGKHTAIAHDLSKLENGQQLETDFDTGKIQPNKTNMSIQYDQDKGRADTLTFNQTRAEQVKSQAEKWAEKNITNEKSKEAFMKHIDNFTKDMSKGFQPTKEPQTFKQPAPEPTKNNELNR